MTKKDYKAIGLVVRDRVLVDQSLSHGSHCVRRLAEKLADVFAADNPRFDRERFLRFVETGVDR
jgi:hypothetical protein